MRQPVKDQTAGNQPPGNKEANPHNLPEHSERTTEIGPSALAPLI
jgi:hypothetical protein